MPARKSMSECKQNRKFIKKCHPSMVRHHSLLRCRRFGFFRGSYCVLGVGSSRRSEGCFRSHFGKVDSWGEDGEEHSRVEDHSFLLLVLNIILGLESG